MQLLLFWRCNANDNPGIGTPLSIAASAGRETVVALLLEAHAAVGARLIDGRTALHGAAMCRDKGGAQVAQRLLKARADLRAECNAGRSALMLTAERGTALVAAVLLAARAEPQQGDKIGATPLLMAAQHDSTAVASLLLGARADPEAEADDQPRALGLAAYMGSTGVLRVLLAARADMSAKAGGFPTALIWAKANKQESCVKMLEEAGAPSGEA